MCIMIHIYKQTFRMITSIHHQCKSKMKRNMNDYMNAQNDNIKFTKEDEDNNMLSFLDVLVTRVDGILCTSVYRKPTFSGLFMKYDSFVPAQYKRRMVYGLISRSWKICSSVESFENEVNFLKTFLVPMVTLIHLSIDRSGNSSNQSRIQIVSYPLA